MWFNLTPTQSLVNSLLVGWGKELEGQKWEKLVGWDKDSLKGKTKAMQAIRTRQGINLPLPTDKQTFISRTGRLHSDPGRQMPSIWTTPSSFFPAVSLLSMTSYDLEQPLGQLGPVVLAVSPPSCLSTPSPAPLPVGWVRSSRGLGPVWAQLSNNKPIPGVISAGVGHDSTT